MFNAQAANFGIIIYFSKDFFHGFSFCQFINQLCFFNIIWINSRKRHLIDSFVVFHE
ncbi:hypothetical protein ACFP3I_24340 [Chryseobacterium arachidis]|uniref:hypothetical protein n=1 Tax=Chryseobacterium arachidis TaxID=1416778 RepID=UPI003616BE8B